MITYVATDVDGTITKTNLSFAFGRFLYQKKIISWWSSLLAVGLYFLHIIGLCSVRRLHTQLFSLIFKGKSAALIGAAADQFLAVCLPELFRSEVCQEIEQWRRRGAIIALLSSSPDFLIERVARALSLEESHSTVYCTDRHGDFSHVGRIVTGDVKAELVKEVRLSTQASIVAMSDSLLDLPLLLEADEAIVVCPGRKLSLIAEQRGWRVIL